MTENSFFSGKRVLVTGAAGFIGSHLVESLMAKGARVRAFIRYTSRGDGGWLSAFTEEQRSNLDVVSGDLRDPQAIREATKGVDIVFHLGALISIPYSYKHPYEVAEVNLMGTLNILMACCEWGVQRLIHTSSSEVYGSAMYVPIDEKHPLQGQSPYSASKIGADKLVESFYCAYNLPVVTVRPFNTYGPRQSARAVIPTIITQALAREVIRLGNLSTRRDFTYVSDTVNGFLCAAQVSGIEGKVVNLGSGREVTILDLCHMVLELTGSQARIEQDDIRFRPARSEVMRLLSDNRLAREQLGWQPKVSLEDGLRQTIVWVKGNLQRFRVGEYEI